MSKKKTNAKQGLITEQFLDLNEIFYRDFVYDYFDIKAINLLHMITKPREFSESINNTELEIGKMKITNPKLKDDLLIKYAKSEIVSTYYHCLETFMRLFIAHASMEKCPWIEITCLTMAEYRKTIKKIAEGTFDSLNNKLDVQETLLDTFVGITDMTKIDMTDEQYNNLKGWIIQCAQELSNMSEYNSLKHGLVLFPSFASMKISAVDNELSKEGDGINILCQEEKEERYILSRKTIFAEYDLKVATITLFSELIRNIIVVGKIHYLGTNEKHIQIPGLRAVAIDYSSFRNMFFENENLGNKFSSYGLPLHYYDDLKESGGAIVIDKGIYKEKVPNEVLPRRLVGTSCLYIAVKTDKQEGVIVYNINPKIWNVWSPFFETTNQFIINDFEYKEYINFEQLIDIYNKEYSKYEANHSKGKRTELLLNAFKKLLNIEIAKVDIELETVYEIKYSKSMNVYTIYRIENFVINSISSSDKAKLFNQKQYEHAILPYGCHECRGIKIATNMEWLLENDTNVSILKQNQVDLG